MIFPLLNTITFRSYRKGESGDQSLAPGIGTETPDEFAVLTSALPTLFFSSYTSTRTTVVPGSWNAEVRASITTTLLSILGVILRDSMCVVGTGSSHTVCQIPLVGVYQMLRGLLTCLPRGCGPASLGSQIATTISWAADGFN